MITKVSSKLYKVFYPDIMVKPLYLSEAELFDCYKVLLDCGFIPS